MTPEQRSDLKWASIGSYTDGSDDIWVECPKHGLRDYRTVAAAQAAVAMHDLCNPARVTP